MSISNVKFLSELNSLKRLVTYYITENKLASIEINHLPQGFEVINSIINQLKAFNLDKRIFNYNSLIISLYGFFEKFIEDIIETYVDDLNINIRDYDRLPEALTKHHLNLSIQMISKVESVKYQGELTKENIINNLYSCVNNKNNYTLNKEVFRQHTSNFRYLTINEVFGKVGIFNISDIILNDPLFQEYITQKFEKKNDENITIEEAYFYIDDLAERRNDVAHGVSGPIMNLNLFNDYIDFFNVYSIAITGLINRNLYQIKLLHNAINLGELTGWYKNGYVICFNTYNNIISVGDNIWGLNEHGYVQSKILSIKLDNILLNVVSDSQNYDIGVELETPLKKSHKILFLKQPLLDLPIKILPLLNAATSLYGFARQEFRGGYSRFLTLPQLFYKNKSRTNCRKHLRYRKGHPPRCS